MLVPRHGPPGHWGHVGKGRDSTTFVNGHINPFHCEDRCLPFQGIQSVPYVVVTAKENSVCISIGLVDKILMRPSLARLTSLICELVFPISPIVSC